MKKEQFVLVNRGMNRDLSVSKTGESSAYENRNIRIDVRDGDTLLSVTNERGNKEVSLGKAIKGELIGWSVIGNHIVLFTHGDSDRIYRIDYNGDSFSMFNGRPLIDADLNFSSENPIETVTYQESDGVIKIYWVDGRNGLRYMNINSTYTNPEDIEVTCKISGSVKSKITKDNSGNNRANGVVQYFLTYYQKRGKQSAIAWASDLVYLSPVTEGGSADGTNSNRVEIELNGIDTSFSNAIVYSVFRSSLNGETVAYIVSDVKIDGDRLLVVDDGANLTSVDASSLLFLGSVDACPGTITHKDGTLFLGDLRSIGKKDYDAIKNILDGGFNDDDLSFVYSDGSDGKEHIRLQDGLRNFEPQLNCTSSQILSFKGGEMYRFAIKFMYNDGTDTEPFYLCDKVNPLYPVVDTAAGEVMRIIVNCRLSESVSRSLKELGIVSAQLMVAEATGADRIVKAQGIINPTVFNAYERTKDRIYAMPSWITRPRNADYANGHFEPIGNANDSTGEIQCNYWDDEPPTPWFKLRKTENGYEYAESFDGIQDPVQIAYSIEYDRNFGESAKWCKAYIFIVKCKPDKQLADMPDISGKDYDKWSKKGTEFADGYIGYRFGILTGHASFKLSKAMKRLYNKIADTLESLGLLYLCPSYSMFKSWVNLSKDRDKKIYINQATYGTSVDSTYSSMLDAINAKVSTSDTSSFDDIASYAKKNFMFVDENVVTFDSPEIQYGDVMADNADLRFRIVGVAKVSENTSDSFIKINGTADNTVSDVTTDTILSAPMMKGRGMVLKDDSKDKDEDLLDSGDFDWGSGNVYYWAHMFQKQGLVPEKGSGSDNESFSISEKVFANRTYSHDTVYTRNPFRLNVDSIRQTFGESNYTTMKVGEIDRFTVGSVKTSLSMPGTKRYPILYSTDADNYSGSSFFESSSPVELAYDCNDHCTISLRSMLFGGKYEQTILPALSKENNDAEEDASLSSMILPWASLPEDIAGAVNLIVPATTVPFEYRRLVSGEYVLACVEPNPNVMLKAKEAIREICIALDYDSVYMLVSVTGYKDEDIVAVIDVSGFVNDWTSANIIVPVDMLAYQPAGVPGKTISAKIINLTLSPVGYSHDDISNLKLCDIDLATKETTNIAEFDKISGKHIEASIRQDIISITKFDNSASTITDGDKYLFIGELYTNRTDNLYGGKSDFAKKNSRYIVAGSYTNLNNGATSVIGNQGDTYIQIYDDLRTTPASSENGVIDIASVLLETHVNLDARTTKQRTTSKIASLDIAGYNSMNSVYSQRNNFVIERDLGEDFYNDMYRSSITWTMQKHDMSSIDEWTHITLANSLNLDSDKGVCRALKRLSNSIIAFQDNGISEVMFNSRTQLSTADGVPVEIANSGKVDGNRYITNNAGCTNKWSIVSGKSGLYFVDNMTKSFCLLGSSVSDLSSRLGFETWFKSRDCQSEWTPVNGGMRSFFDNVHSDIYIIGGESDDAPALVYNERLQSFTSFFDYSSVPMMSNIVDRFVSFRDGSLWLQNEGEYCKFFGRKYPFHVTYRATPNPYRDKIWTNIEYRADFYDVPDDFTGSIESIGAERYNEDETFDFMRFWNEYQTTPYEDENVLLRPVKKFRTWRLAIPRARRTDKNPYGLDRIRNPWLMMTMKKNNPDGLMQLHDVIVTYYE